ESATFDAMVELMTSGRYDMYIFDMMPHGHAIRFLGMGQLLDAWIDKVVETRKKAAEYGDVAAVMSGKGSLAQEDEILNELEFIRSRLDFVSNVMRDTEHTAFFYVLIPEEMAILDTQKAIKMFGEFGIPISGVIVNQVYPPELLVEESTPEFLKNRIRMQQEHMKRIKELFSDKILAVVPMLDREPKGLDMLRKLAEMVYG
ncbi:MAG: ArsA-related P-loop ATPase, partial [Candidatus Korarchaeum sp.]